MKPTTMLYRNLLAMETEEVIRCHPIDAVVLLGACDVHARADHGRDPRRTSFLSSFLADPCCAEIGADRCRQWLGRLEILG